MRRILGAWPRKTAFALLIAVWSGSARPQVTLDGSLGGPSGSLAGPDFQIDANLGRQAGSNLFHSFGVFNVNAGESAIFNDVGAVSLVENILSRVTGGSASNIDGMLRTAFDNATPNLFLLNPAGVVFGPHASLDVQGSFHVSTADYIELADGVRFDALPSPNDTLLTAAPPAAFGFLREQPAAIAFRGSGSGSEPEFAVPEDETLSVIGGNVEITGAAMLKAPGGRVNLASLAAAGKVKLGNAVLEAESSGPLGTITMQGSTLDVSERQGGATSGGSVVIRRGRFVVDDSKVLANTVNGNSQGIDIELTDAMWVTNRSSFEARTSGPGNGGSLNIQAKEILLEGRSNLDACSASPGCVVRGDVCLNCGHAGDIAIETGRLQLTGGSRINANTQTPGNAGNVTVNATEEVVLADDSQVQTAARLRARTGAPRGGAVLGNGGNIVIDTGRLELNRGGNISALTSGDGMAGDVNITAKEVLLKGKVDGGGLSSLLATTDTGRGAGGEIAINTDRLSLADGATIRTRTNGPGKGGDIKIEANDIVLEGGSTLLADSIGTAKVCGQDCGDAGNVSVGARDSLRLFNDSHISVETAQADAGDITLDVGFLLHLREQSSITTSVAPGTDGKGTGNGGDINIDPVFTVLDRGSKIIANALEGSAGNIRIRTDFLFRSPDSEIKASNQFGVEGNVEIDSPDTDVISSALELPESFLDAATLLTQGCAPGADLSRLVVRKYEVLPDSPAALRVPPPGGLLNADAQGGGFVLPRETLGPGFEHSSACDGEG